MNHLSRPLATLQAWSERMAADPTNSAADRALWAQINADIDAYAARDEPPRQDETLWETT